MKFAYDTKANYEPVQQQEQQDSSEPAEIIINEWGPSRIFDTCTSFSTAIIKIVTHYVHTFHGSQLSTTVVQSLNRAAHKLDHFPFRQKIKITYSHQCMTHITIHHHVDKKWIFHRFPNFSKNAVQSLNRAVHKLDFCESCNRWPHTSKETLIDSWRQNNQNQTWSNEIKNEITNQN